MANETQLGAPFTGSQIKKIRIQKKLELKDVQALLMHHTGKELGLSTLSRMETGKGRGPTIDELLAFAVILGATPNRLLFGGRDLIQSRLRVTKKAVYTAFEVWAWADALQPLGWMTRLERIIDEIRSGPSAALVHRQLTAEELLEWNRQRARQDAEFDQHNEFVKLNRVANPPSETPEELLQRARSSERYLEFVRSMDGLIAEGMTWQDLRDELESKAAEAQRRMRAHGGDDGEH